MSRLDSAIRRLKAQRRCLDWACAEIADRDGAVLELGLGNGRTYDHLRARLGADRIYVFDRVLACHPDSKPGAKRFFLGEIAETLPKVAETIGARAVLAHLDLGAGDTVETAANLQRVGENLVPLMVSGGLVIADQPLEGRGWAGHFRRLPLPEGIQENRYFIYRKN